MNRDDVIRWAEEAGACWGVCGGCSKVDVFCGNSLERFAALVAAAEREACADICDQHSSIEGIAQECAAAIRARGESNEPR